MADAFNGGDCHEQLVAGIQKGSAQQIVLDIAAIRQADIRLSKQALEELGLDAKAAQTVIDYARSIFMNAIRCAHVNQTTKSTTLK